MLDNYLFTIENRTAVAAVVAVGSDVDVDIDSDNKTNANRKYRTDNWVKQWRRKENIKNKIKKEKNTETDTATCYERERNHVDKPFWIIMNGNEKENENEIVNVHCPV